MYEISNNEFQQKFTSHAKCNITDRTLYMQLLVYEISNKGTGRTHPMQNLVDIQLYVQFQKNEKSCP